MKGIAIFYVSVDHTLNSKSIITAEAWICKTKEIVSEVVEELKKMDYKVLFIPVYEKNTRLEVIELSQSNDPLMTPSKNDDLPKFKGKFQYAEEGTPNRPYGVKKSVNIQNDKYETVENFLGNSKISVPVKVKTRKPKNG